MIASSCSCCWWTRPTRFGLGARESPAREGCVPIQQVNEPVYEALMRVKAEITAEIRAEVTAEVEAEIAAHLGGKRGNAGHLGRASPPHRSLGA